MKKKPFRILAVLFLALAVSLAVSSVALAKTVNDRLVSATKVVREMAGQNDA